MTCTVFQSIFEQEALLHGIGQDEWDTEQFYILSMNRRGGTPMSLAALFRARLPAHCTLTNPVSSPLPLLSPKKISRFLFYIFGFDREDPG